MTTKNITKTCWKHIFVKFKLHNLVFEKCLRLWQTSVDCYVFSIYLAVGKALKQTHTYIDRQYIVHRKGTLLRSWFQFLVTVYNIERKFNTSIQYKCTKCTMLNVIGFYVIRKSGHFFSLLKESGQYVSSEQLCGKWGFVKLILAIRSI